MILALKNGKLIPPTTVVAGRKRTLHLAAECDRIENQLRDPERKRRFEEGLYTGCTYDSWRSGAQQALRMHNLELRLLTEWLEAQGASLLKRASTLLQSLVADEVEFSESELAFVAELAAYCKGQG